MPLSQLKDKYPKLYNKSLKTYKGRENLINKSIKLLDCQWKDVLFLSCVDPSLIFISLELLGLFDKNDYEILKFPISCLKNKEFCLYDEEENR